MRSQTCGQVNATHVGDTVQLCGWVNKRRDHGGVIFVDLRDRDGLVQVVFDPDTPDVFALAEQLRNEFVIRLSGRVRPRPEGTVNPELSSGEIEVLGLELEILNRSETPPFQLDDDDVGEEHRLRYQPEFTQLDIEMSFVEEEDVMSLMEAMIRQVFKTQLDVDLANPFPRMTYAESIERFGVDRPDLRVPMEMVTVSDLVADIDFKVFSARRRSRACSSAPAPRTAT